MGLWRTLFPRKCWCGSGLTEGYCTHRATIRQAGTGRPTRLQKAVATHGNPTVKRRRR
jgi:hypothetical protein